MRHEADEAALSASGAELLPIGSEDSAISAAIGTSGPVQVLICALGPLHPGTAQQATDSAGVARDLGFLERVLTMAGSRIESVVLVSTVLTLAPPVDRRYYAGWRGVVEQEMRELVGQKAPGAAVSILYPGRLTEKRDFRHMASLVYTTYRRLAEIADRGGRATTEFRVVGLDARMWLLARSASLGLSSFSPRPSGPGALTDWTAKATRQDPSRSER